MHCILLYNPVSGRQRERRAELLGRVADALTALGHRIELTATTGPGSATLQAREAVRDGAESVFACGGDGTVNEVLQGLVCETGEPGAALGIIPLGSANALARDLRLSLDPLKAALAQVNATPRAIPVGRVEYGKVESGGKVRYFTVMAGAGPDGALVYDSLSAQKTIMGRWEYYVRAARLFATRRFGAFEVEYADAASGGLVTQKAVSAMAVRVGNLGGLFSGLAGRGAGVEDAQLRLLILSGPAWLSLPLWFVSGWLGLNGVNRFLRCVKTDSFACRPLSGPSPQFEADGEWLGRIPMRVSVVRDAVRILMPDV